MCRVPCVRMIQRAPPVLTFEMAPGSACVDAKKWPTCNHPSAQLPMVLGMQ